MATTNSITTTYVGKDSGQFISPVLKSGLTLANDGLTIRNEVNYKSRITKLALSGIIKDATCDFDPTGTVTQTESWLTVKLLEVNLQLCKNDYYPDFIGQDMFPGSPMNQAFLQYLLIRIGETVADALETAIWQGVAGAGSFDGFETKFAADATVVDVSTPVAITSSNAISEARRALAAASASIIAKSDTYLYVGSTVYFALKQAYNSADAGAPNDRELVTVDGVKVFYAPGMKAGSMVVAQKSNLFFGTWASSDAQEIAVKDMKEVDLSDNIRFAMSFFAGVGYAYGAEVVYYASV